MEKFGNNQSMKTIIVFGVFVADLCFFSKQIPLSGQTIKGNNHIIGPGGKGSNQAISAARLGADVQFITKIGKDNYSDMALATFKDSGVKTKYIIQEETLNTGVAGIFVSESSGENAITIVPGAAGTIKNEDIDNLKDVFVKSNIFLTQLETPLKTTLYALKKAKDNGCTTILNPAPAKDIDQKLFSSIDFFTPNEIEAGHFLKKDLKSKSDIESAAKDFLDKGIKNIIITLGEKGLYFANNQEKYFVDTFKLKNKVVDTTGAGDAFNGAFAFALANDYKFKDALEFANKIAAISTTKLGAANSMPRFNEIKKY